MNTNDNKLRLTSQRTAFTLVEMLIVGAIIVILAGLTLLAANWTATAAKETKTRATIQKIDSAMQQIIESYEEKYRTLQNEFYRDFATSSLAEVGGQNIPLHLIRDLMRMELPQNWAEVYDTNNPDRPLGPIAIKLAENKYYSDLQPGELTADPYPDQWVPEKYNNYPLLHYYWMEYTNAKLLGKEPNRAALLFLIIQNLKPEALESFHESEIADTDGDGLLEFVDAWGNPIYFLRNAPAFSGSELQPDILSLAKYVPKKIKAENEQWWADRGTEMTAAMTQAMQDYPDLLGIQSGAANNQDNSYRWFLYPLIYSAGPDGKYDMITEHLTPTSPAVGTSGILDPFTFPAGMPSDIDGNGLLNHFDNIHNHQQYKKN